MRCLCRTFYRIRVSAGEDTRLKAQAFIIPFDAFAQTQTAQWQLKGEVWRSAHQEIGVALAGVEDEGERVGTAFVAGAQMGGNALDPRGALFAGERVKGQLARPDHLMRRQETVAHAEYQPLAIVALAIFAGAAKHRRGVVLIGGATNNATLPLGSRYQRDFLLFLLLAHAQPSTCFDVLGLGNRDVVWSFLMVADSRNTA